MEKALFLNGVFESVLEEIRTSQTESENSINYLQPYSTQAISLLNVEKPTQERPVKLYISTTTNLDKICYTAEVVGWEDKTQIDSGRISELNLHIKQFQPGEEQIYLENSDGKKYRNLISIRDLKPVINLYSVTTLRKVSDNLPLLPRTQAGRWSYVFPVADVLDSSSTIFEEDLRIQEEDEVRQSKELSSEARRNRLKSASKQPEQSQLISTYFKRNADVMVEVLLRANGICEECRKEAPFIRAKDGTPYLEIHHKQPLSEGGDDTVENAIAVCPNCHRRLHFGIN